MSDVFCSLPHSLLPQLDAGDDNISAMVYLTTIQLSEDEELAISKMQSKSYELKRAIENTEYCLLYLNKVSNDMESSITKRFDDIIRFGKQEKGASIKEIKRIFTTKEERIKQQISELKLYQKQISEFKEKTNIIKEENVLDTKQITDFVINRSATLINYHFDGSIHLKSLIHPFIETQNERNIAVIYRYFRNFGVLNGYLVPQSPHIRLANIGYHSVDIILNANDNDNDNEGNTLKRAYSEEYKIEMLAITDGMRGCGWNEIATVISLEFELTNLSQNTQYMVRCCSKNKYGYSSWSKAKKFRTSKQLRMQEGVQDKTDTYQYIYIAPTESVQHKLFKIVNRHGIHNDETYRYFKRCKGFHITIGPKLKHNLKDDNDNIISNRDIIRELYELGLKNHTCRGSAKKWKIAQSDYKISKWKIGGIHYIVASFHNNNRLFNICCTYLRAKGWINAKHKNWNITLALNNDLNKAQIMQCLDILTANCTIDCDWKWYAITQNANGSIQWHDECYPVYQL